MASLYPSRRVRLAALLWAHRIVPSQTLRRVLLRAAMRVPDFAMAESSAALSGLDAKMALDMTRAALRSGDDSRFAILLELARRAKVWPQPVAAKLLKSAWKARSNNAGATILIEILERLDSPAGTELVAAMRAASPVQAAAAATAIKANRGSQTCDYLIAEAHMHERAGDAHAAIACLVQAKAVSPNAEEAFSVLENLLPRHIDSTGSVRAEFVPPVGKRVALFVGANTSVSDAMAYGANENWDIILTNYKADIAQPDAWIQALGSEHVPRLLHLTNEYADLNDPVVTDLSMQCDKSVVHLLRHIHEFLDGAARTLSGRHEETIAMLSSDRLFADLRWRLAIIHYLQREQPAAIIVCASNSEKIDAHRRIAARLGLQGRQVWAYDGRSVDRWAKARSAIWNAPATVGVDAEGRANAALKPEAIKCDLKKAEAWADGIASTWSEEERPIIALLATPDRVFGPLAGLLTRKLCDRVRWVQFHDYAHLPERASQDDWAVDILDRIKLPAPERRRGMPANGVFTRSREAFEASRSPTDIFCELSNVDKHLVDDPAQTAAIIGHAVASAAVNVPGLLSTAHAMARLWERVPKLAGAVVMPTRRPSFRIAAREIRQAGHPVIEPMAVYMSRMGRYRPLIADHILAIDTASRDLVRERFSLATAQIHVVGSIRTEQVLMAARAAAYEQNTSGRILIITQAGSLRQNIALVRTTLNAMQRFVPNMEAVIKLHPGEPAFHANSYEQEVTLSGCLNNVRIVQHDDPHRLVMESSFVISRFSNLVMEAAVLGRAVIIHQTDSETELPVPFDAMGLAALSRTELELGSLMKDFSQCGPQWHVLKDRRQTYFENNKLLINSGALERSDEIMNDVFLKKQFKL